MGNRFFTLTGYHSLIEAHGILASITFLAVVPAAIFLMRFYGRQPRMALRLHIWLQILALLLLTVVFILGNFAVGPKRSLTNPHHGIGVALYVLLWVQVIGGGLVHRSEKNKRRLYIPLKAMLHHWLGRAIALLGITQIALGLTLYGSPVYLFVLYSLWVFGLVVLYFFLQWQYERRRARYGSDGGSYYTEEVVEDKNRHHTGVGKLAAAGAAGAGLAALWRRRSSRNRPNRQNEVGTESSVSYVEDEKYDNTPRRNWGRRILEVGAIGGGLAAVKKVFDRRRDEDDVSEAGPYRPPLGGNQSVSTASMSRIEEGLPPPRPMTPTGGSPGYVRPSHPLAQPPMTPGSGRRHSTSELSYYSYMSGYPSRRDRRHRTFRDTLAAGGTVFAVRQLFKSRRQRKEERRAEELRNQRLEEERIARMNSASRYTGDGIPPPRRTRPMQGSQTASDFSSLTEGTARPVASGALPVAAAGTAAASALADRNRIRPVGTDPVITNPGAPIPGPLPAGVPPTPPMHRPDPLSSGSEIYMTGSGRTRHRHHLRTDTATGLAGATVGAAAVDAAHRRASGRNTDSMESPPVSIKMKVHKDGVTLRRLTQEEEAAQREERRRQRRARRNSSLSSGSGPEVVGGDAAAEARWRRTEAMEARQAAENEAAAGGLPPPSRPGVISPMPSPPPNLRPGPSAAIDPRTGQAYNVPLPPPIPEASVSNIGAGSITSPGTEASGATDYAKNRRRRRAEREQAKLVREGRAGNTVDFT